MPCPLLTVYLNRLRLANFRPQTIDARGTCLSAFAATLGDRSLAEATRIDVEAYLTRPLAPESRRTYRSHLRAFYGWCLEEGHVLEDPTARIPAVRVKRGTPRPVPDADLLRALENADRRMHVWLLLMCLAGLRCMEVAALRPADLLDSPAGPLLYLREVKGGGTATVPAHPALVAALHAMPIRDGLWWDLTPHALSTQVNRYLRAVGVPSTAHALRHWAGTNWYRVSGHDLLTTARLMRHTSVDTTTIYAQISPERPAEVARAVTLRAS